jgi:hypothetical protein
MTVKTQSGKVITKDGKVSCECCESPEECCMYSADFVTTGFYSENDFPAEIRITRGSQTEVINRSGFEYIGSIFSAKVIGGEWVFTGPGDEQWAQRECLITSDSSVRDLFNDTYELQDFGLDDEVGPCGGIFFNQSTTLFRVSACRWVGQVTFVVYSPIPTDDPADPCDSPRIISAEVTLLPPRRRTGFVLNYWQIDIYAPELDFLLTSQKQCHPTQPFQFCAEDSDMSSPEGFYIYYNIV